MGIGAISKAWRTSSLSPFFQFRAQASQQGTVMPDDLILLLFSIQIILGRASSTKGLRHGFHSIPKYGKRKAEVTRDR